MRARARFRVVASERVAEALTNATAQVRGAAPWVDLHAGAAARSIREAMRAAFWSWYDQHQAEEVLELRVLWVVRVTVEVRDLEPVFVLLFGDRPVSGGAS